MEDKPGKITALFGGTFDPVHPGHKAIAERCLEIPGVSEVIFIPARANPIANKTHRFSDQHRLQLIQGMIRDQAGMSVSTLELERQEPSYSYKTIESFKNQGYRSLAWIIGSDQLPHLHRWKNLDAILKNAKFIVFQRAGYPINIPTHLPPEKFLIMDDFDMPVSSTEIRQILDGARITSGGWNDPAYLKLVRSLDTNHD